MTTPNPLNPTLVAASRRRARRLRSRIVSRLLVRAFEGLIARGRTRPAPALPRPVQQPA